MSFLQQFDSFVISDARKWRLDVGQLGYIAPNELKIGLAISDSALHQMTDELFRQLHNVIKLGVSNFRLDHPKFSQVAARLGLFCAERWAKGINLPERHGHGFNVKLA